MRGYKILINDTVNISGGISAGSTAVMFSYNGGRFRLCFNSLNEAGTVVYKWYENDLMLGDKIRIIYSDDVVNSEPCNIVDYNDIESMRKLELEVYYTMKSELIEEGILNEDGQTKNSVGNKNRKGL
jgi:hypothetical protein